MATTVKRIAGSRHTPARAEDHAGAGPAHDRQGQYARRRRARRHRKSQASGKVAGAVHVSRGMLEFRADPELPSHDKNFAKDKAVIL